jgi:hypothetical protein
MIYWCNMASTGFPKVRASLLSRQLLDADLQPLMTAGVIASQLRRAFWAAIASGLAAAIAVAVFLFASASPASGDVKLTYQMGKQQITTTCGALVVDHPADTVTFTPDGGSASVFKSADVVKVTTC